MKKLPRQHTKTPVYETRKDVLTSPSRVTGTGKVATSEKYVPEFFVTPRAYVSHVGDTLMSIVATWSTCEADGSTRDVTATVRIYRAAEPAPTYDGVIRWEIRSTPATGNVITAK